MWGCIISDLIGNNPKEKNLQEISLEGKVYSKNTILTMAILDAYLHDKDYEYYLKKYINDYKNYFKDEKSFNLLKWALNKEEGLSTTNEAMVRISPIAYLTKNKEELKLNVKKATIPTHNTKEAVKCSETIAEIIFLARQKYPKEEIIKTLELKYLPYNTFINDETCYNSIDNCLNSVFSADNFFTSLQKIYPFLTNDSASACIVGSMAEALYGIDNNLIYEAKKRIPICFSELLEEGNARILKK